MPDETPNPTAPEPGAESTTSSPPGPGPDGTTPEPAGPRRAVSSADMPPRRPVYRGEELDPERGPGLGCFWFQAIILGFFFVLIPIGVNLEWPYELLAFLLIVVLALLFFTGQTVIFLLRLVAADRRAQGRRRPLSSPTKTVGELEDDHRVANAVRSRRPADVDPAPADTLRDSESMIRESRVAGTVAEGEDASGSAAALDRDVDSAGAGAAGGAAPRTDGGVDVPQGGMAGEDNAVAPVKTHESLPESHGTGSTRTETAVAPDAPDGDDDAAGDAPPTPPSDEATPEEPDPGVRQ